MGREEPQPDPADSDDDAAITESFATFAARTALGIAEGKHLNVLRSQLTDAGLSEPQIDIVFGAAIPYWAAHTRIQGAEHVTLGLLLAGGGAGLTYWQYASAVSEAGRDGSATYWVFSGAIVAGALLAFRGVLRLSSDISRKRMCEREMARLTSTSGELAPYMRLVLARLTETAR